MLKYFLQIEKQLKLQINQFNLKNLFFDLFYKNRGAWFKPNKPWFLPTLVHSKKTCYRNG